MSDALGPPPLTRSVSSGSFENMLKALVVASLTFLAAATIVGQVIMHGQGDTSAISIRYGLLHVVTGCGVSELVRGQREYPLPVACELVPAIIAFVVFLRRHETPVRNKS
jgi:hypothetical protein